MGPAQRMPKDDFHKADLENCDMNSHGGYARHDYQSSFRSRMNQRSFLPHLRYHVTNRLTKYGI